MTNIAQELRDNLCHENCGCYEDKKECVQVRGAIEIERLLAECREHQGRIVEYVAEIERLRTDYDILKGDYNCLLADYELVRRRPT